MRFPILNGNSTEINEPEATRMVRSAIDQGVNYLDTAYVYHGGSSEKFLGRALKDGYRDKVKIATKLPIWNVKSEDSFEQLLSEQLERLQTDHIDFYLLHGLGSQTWRGTVKTFDLISKANKALEDGRIRHLGFSFHDNYDAFEEIATGYDKWTFCQIQYNYLDTEKQAGTKGLKLAASLGLAVIVMEPLLGGRLATLPASVQQAVDEFPVKRTPVEWALQWLWSQPEVSLILSGMSTFEQVQDNIKFASRSKVNSFSSDEQGLIEQLQQRFQERVAIPCTDCKYCMPCASGVQIPQIFSIYNDGKFWDNPNMAVHRYNHQLKDGERANECIECGACESICPQAIKITEWLPKVHAELSETSVAATP